MHFTEACAVTQLATAERNRQLARALADPARELLRPPPAEWALIAAFYAAVHFVHAYLCEQQRYEPRTPADREAAVARITALRPAATSYTRLRYLGQYARHLPL